MTEHGGYSNGNNLDQRLTETEKATATLAGQVQQIGKALGDVVDQLSRNREAQERGFRELRHEIRQEVAEVRAPKGQWVGLFSVLIALAGLVGGPFLVYASNAQEQAGRMEQRQHDAAVERAASSAMLSERRFWLNREFDRLNADLAQWKEIRKAEEPERWRRADALADREAVERRMDRLQDLMLRESNRKTEGAQ